MQGTTKLLALLVYNLYSYIYPNTHSKNFTPAVIPVPELLHGPIHSPQTSQIEFLEESSTGQCVGAIP